MLKYDEFKGVYGLIPACATPDAFKWSSTDTIDEEAQREIVSNLIRDGVDGIITTGSTGECHTLLWKEQQKLFDIVVDEVNSRVPLLVGTWAPNTREAIMKTRYAVDAGVDGVMNGPPQYVEPTVDNTIQYYRDLAEACPDTAIMIYHNPNAFRVTIPVERFNEIKEIPQVLSMKESMADVPRMKELAKIAGDKICFQTYEPFAMEALQHGFGGIWSAHSMCMGPEPVLKLYQAITKKDWTTAQMITDATMKIYTDFFQRCGGFDLFMKYQVNAMHECVNHAGYARTGPARPMFSHCPEQVLKACRMHADDWRALVEKCR